MAWFSSAGKGDRSGASVVPTCRTNPQTLLVPAPAYPPISDYALIGDCRTAALVSSSGSIDWLCLPRFDSPSFFNRLLNWDHGGYCAIRPNGRYSVRRSYRVDTAILVTEFHTAYGRVRVTDLMPVVSHEDRQMRLFPLRHLLRRIEGLDGSVELDLIVRPRPDDGRFTPTFHSRGHGIYCADLGGSALFAASDAPMCISSGELAGTVVVRRGESRSLWLSYAEDSPAVYPFVGQAAKAIDEASDYWTAWASRCTYGGPYRERAIRSAITLKLLTYAPSGAIVAAPTTSLPERIGGELNWDYRYCWLRDASLTARSFFHLGFDSEAAAFMRWLTHATRLTYPDLHVMYDVHGESSLPERLLSSFEGYQQSKPVRVGNAASSQFQLDVYGELLEGLLTYVDAGYRLDRDTQRWVIRMADLVAERWSQPDHGIWEIRKNPRHYVHSKVLCWVALDRAERLARRFTFPVSTSAWTHARGAIRRTVLKTGYSNVRRSFVQVLGGRHLDASSLMFGLCGFIDGKDPRMASTITIIQRVLGRGPLIYRYLREEQTGPEEGAFLPCSFWLVEALAAAGRFEEARDFMDRLHGAANDIGLYAEEMRPDDGLSLGNSPLALTHVAHLSAVVRLDQRR